MGAGYKCSTVSAIDRFSTRAFQCLILVRKGKGPEVGVYLPLDCFISASLPDGWMETREAERIGLGKGVGFIYLKYLLRLVPGRKWILIGVSRDTLGRLHHTEGKRISLSLFEKEMV